MTLSPDLHFAEMIRDYLDTAASRTAGVPDIPVDRIDDGGEIARPRIVVRADESGSAKRVRGFNISVAVDFLDEQGTTNAATASGWLRAIDLRLRDEAALFAFIAALPDGDRQGWEYIDHSFPSPADIKRNPDTATTLMEVILRLLVCLD